MSSYVCRVKFFCFFTLTFSVYVLIQNIGIHACLVIICIFNRECLFVFEECGFYDFTVTRSLCFVSYCHVHTHSEC
jgi:hypothetical protein